MSEAKSLPDYLDVDYIDGEGETLEDYPSIEDKIERAIGVMKQGFEQYENPAAVWTGGKDSTLMPYFIKEAAERHDLEVSPVVFVDHYQYFDEITDFVEHWAEEWGLDVIWARNEDVGTYVDENGLEPGDDIPVFELSEYNQYHVREILEYEEDMFPFLLDTYVGNHLLKTVALNDIFKEHNINGVISDARWGEQEARADETFFNPRHDPDVYPPYDRIQPIPQFEENVVWGAFWYLAVPDTVKNHPEDGYVPTSDTDLPEGAMQEDAPVSPKYLAGFRSLGSKVSTNKPAKEPAWPQDMENMTKRAGRVQDKEDLTERLRNSSYM